MFPADADRPSQDEWLSSVELPPVASMRTILDALWRIPRHIISDGYDIALEALSNQVPITIHEYPTGTECWTWSIPEKWVCRDAWLETLDGHRLFSLADHPLRVVSYSLPFDGTVSREELLRHLHVHPKLPSAIPYAFKLYERDWGLCCSQEERDQLNDAEYRVRIDSEFVDGSLKVGEVVLPGVSQDCIVLVAHLCHPSMANDDMAGVVVAVEVMRQLMQRQGLHYTYRLLIVPETIGTIAYLSHHESLIPSMKGGLFLEMVGLDNPAHLQHSYKSDSEIDRCFELALRDLDDAALVGAFRMVIGNDERQFNAPGVRVPMLSLSRVLPRNDPDWPYAEYHSSMDDATLVSDQRLDQTVAITLGMIAALEENRIVRNRFKGEIFMSRFGLHRDFYKDPQAHKALFDVMFEIDGTKSIAGIAERCGLPLWEVRAIVEDLSRQDLVELVERV